MIIACYNVYNEIEYLPKSVDSIYRYADKLVFVDGRYKDFHPDKPVESTDGTLEWINDKDNDPDGKFQLIEAPEDGWENQPIKRSAYLIGKAGDIYVVIDGHDVITEWRAPRMILDVAGMARLDILDNDPPISAKAPRLIGHVEGLHYITHAYLVDGNDEFYLNGGWDQQAVMSPELFDKKVLKEQFTCTMRHYGKQNKALQERQEQVKIEREKIEMYDAAHGLNFEVDSRVAIERVAKKFYDYYKRVHLVKGIPIISYEGIRKIVEAKAQLYEKNTRDIQERKGTQKEKRVTCSICGWICPSGMHLVDHFVKEHQEVVME